MNAGLGVLAEFVARDDLGDLRAIVVTHLRADHSLDLMVLAYRRTFPARLPRIPLYIPAEALERFRTFDRALGIESFPRYEFADQRCLQRTRVGSRQRAAKDLTGGV